MTTHANTCPMPPAAVVDTYFMEHRAKLIDIAAFMDRIDRASSSTPNLSSNEVGDEDFRLKAMREAIAVLIDGEGERAKRILNLLSDPTPYPLESAGIKGASGAWPGGIPGKDGNPTIQ